MLMENYSHSNQLYMLTNLFFSGCLAVYQPPLAPRHDLCERTAIAVASIFPESLVNCAVGFEFLNSNSPYCNYCESILNEDVWFHLLNRYEKIQGQETWLDKEDQHCMLCRCSKHCKTKSGVQIKSVLALLKSTKISYQLKNGRSEAEVYIYFNTCDGSLEEPWHLQKKSYTSSKIYLS